MTDMNNETPIRRDWDAFLLMEGTNAILYQQNPAKVEKDFNFLPQLVT